MSMYPSASLLTQLLLVCSAITIATTTLLAHAAGTLPPEDKSLWEIKIVDGASWLIEGRVMMRINSTAEWGYVCSDYFKDTDFAPLATCHSVGLLGIHQASFLPMPLVTLDHPINLDDVKCSANDTFIQNCSHNPVGVHNCYDGGREISGVKCVIPPEMWEFRIVGGTSPTNGRVEMRPLPSLAWGSIYNGIFLQGGSYTVNAGRAICKTLGFNVSVTPPVVIDVPYVSPGPAYLYPRYCYNTDKYLQNCSAYDLTRYSWGEANQLAIECDPTWEFKLVDGPTPWEGRVEARVSTALNFSRVCAEGIDTDALYTICQKSGLTNASYGRKVPFGTYGIDNATDPHILTNVRCYYQAVTSEIDFCSFDSLWSGKCGNNQLNLRCPPFDPNKWKFRLRSTTIWTEGYFEMNMNEAVGEPWDPVGYCLSPLEVQQACRIVNRTGWTYPPSVTTGSTGGKPVAMGSPSCPTAWNNTFADCRVSKGTYLTYTGSACNYYAAYIDCNPPNPYVEWPEKWQFRLVSNASYLENATLVNDTYQENGTWTEEYWTPGTFADGVCINGTWTEKVNCTGVLNDTIIALQISIAGAYVGGVSQTTSYAAGVCTGGSWIEGVCSGTWEPSSTTSPTCDGGVWINATCTGNVVPGVVTTSTLIEGVCVGGTWTNGLCSGGGIWKSSEMVNRTWKPCHKKNATTVNSTLLDGVCVGGYWTQGKCTGQWNETYTAPETYNCTDDGVPDILNRNCTNNGTFIVLPGGNETLTKSLVEGVCVGGEWRRGKCSGVWQPTNETEREWEPTCTMITTYTINSTLAPGVCTNGTFVSGICNGVWEPNSTTLDVCVNGTWDNDTCVNGTHILGNTTTETQVDGMCVNGTWSGGNCTGVWVSVFTTEMWAPCSVDTFTTVTSSTVPGVCYDGGWSSGVCVGTWSPTYTQPNSCTGGGTIVNGSCTSGTLVPGATVSSSTMVGVCVGGGWENGVCLGTWRPSVKANVTYDPDCSTSSSSVSTSIVPGVCTNGTFVSGICNGVWETNSTTLGITTTETQVDGMCVNGTWSGGMCTGVWVPHMDITVQCVPPSGDASTLCVMTLPDYAILQNRTLLGPTYVAPEYVNGSAFPRLREGRVEMRMDVDQPWLRVADTSDIIARRFLCDAFNWTDTEYSAHVPVGRYGVGEGNFSFTGVGCPGYSPFLSGGVRWCSHNAPPSYTCNCNDLALECIPFNPSYRLTNGTTAYNGRFQMKPYEAASWGGICQYGFDTNAAYAACNQLGLRNYSKAPEYRPWDLSGYGDWINYAQCAGKDAFINCTAPYSIGNLYYSCGESIGIECNPLNLNPALFQYRLVNGSNLRNGRVEMRYDATFPWQRVCHSTAYYARLAACWSVGYTDTPWTAGVGAGTYGYGDPSVLFAATGLGCSSTETHLNNCSFERPVYTYPCAEDLVVNCPAYQPEYRLIPFERENAGRVEFRPYPTAPWGNINDGTFGVNEIAVACRQFGFNESREPQQTFRMTGPYQPTYLYSLTCHPNGTNLVDNCTLPTRLYDSMGSYYSLGIDCDPRRWRITDGPSLGRGRVEFRPYVNSAWGTVCNDGFKTSHTAWNAVCHSAGYLNATTAKPEWHGEGSGTIYIDDLVCPPGVFYIEYCTHRPIGDSNCGHNEDSGVNCFAPEENKTVWEYRLNGGTSASNGRLEVRPDSSSPWGSVCQDSFNYSFHTWKAVCSTVGFPTDRAEFRQYSSNGGLIYLDHFDCAPGIDHLVNCTSFPLGSFGCNEDQMAGVDCNPPIITQDEYEFRFRPIPGADPNTTQTGGMLEMRPGPDREWGSICPGNTSLLTQDLLVAACNMFGIAYTTPRFTSQFGNGSGYVYLSDPVCTGAPGETLVNCTYGLLYENDCDHSDDIGIECIPATCPPMMDSAIILGNDGSVFTTLDITEAEMQRGGEYIVDTTGMLLNLTFMPGVYSYVIGFIPTLPPAPTPPAPNTTTPAPTDPNTTTTKPPTTYPTLPPKTSPTTTTPPTTAPPTTTPDPNTTTTTPAPTPDPWEGLTGLVVVASESIDNTIRGNWDGFSRLGVPTNLTLTILSNRSAKVYFTGIPEYKAMTSGELQVRALGATMFDGLCTGSSSSPNGVLMLRVRIAKEGDKTLDGINDATVVISIGNVVIETATMGGGAAADMQALVAFALLPCADPRTRASFGSIRALSPFAVSDTYFGAIIGNLIFAAGVFLVHMAVLLVVRLCLKTRRWVTIMALCRFPSVSLNAIVVVYTGTMFSASQIIVINDADGFTMAIGYLTFVVSFLLPPTFVAIAYFFIERAYLTFEAEEWLKEHPFIKRLWLIIPEGTINSPETRQAFGSLIGYRLINHAWLTLPFWTSCVVGLMALIQPNSIPECQALFSVAGLAFLAMAALVLWKRPYRTQFANGMYSVGKILTGLLMFLMAAAVTDDVSGERAATGAIVIGVMITATTCLRILGTLATMALDMKMNSENLPLTTVWVHLIGKAQRSTLQFDIDSDELKDIEKTNKEERGEDDNETLLLPKLVVDAGMFDVGDDTPSSPPPAEANTPQLPAPPKKEASDDSDDFFGESLSSNDSNKKGTTSPPPHSITAASPAGDNSDQPLSLEEEENSAPSKAPQSMPIPQGSVSDDFDFSDESNSEKGAPAPKSSNGIVRRDNAANAIKKNLSVSSLDDDDIDFIL